MHNPSQPQPVRQATTGDAASTQVGVHRGVGGHQAGAARRRPLWCRWTPSKRRVQASAAVPADIKQAPRAGACKPILPMNWPTIYWIHDDGKKSKQSSPVVSDAPWMDSPASVSCCRGTIKSKSRRTRPSSSVGEKICRWSVVASPPCFS